MHREGFGYLVELDNRYTFTHSGAQLALIVSHFDGRWHYDNHQFYTADKLEFHVVIPLSNQLNLLYFTSQYIHRDYELELLGFKDTLFRVEWNTFIIFNALSLKCYVLCDDLTQ